MVSDLRGPLRSSRDQIVQGIWGRHTAVVDFCEPNYLVTTYIAEFWNTVSNLSYVLLGLLAIYYARKERLPERAIACHVALVVLGLGSACFHATLMKTTMMMDDLPMMWLVSVLLYCVVQLEPSKTNMPLILVLLAINLIVVALDLIEANQWFHYISFGAIALIAAGRLLWLVLKHPKSLAPLTRKWSLEMFATGTVCILVAFAIWNIDNIYCDNIHAFQERTGLPSLLLNGHVYWHLLTAIGEYLVVTAGTCITLSIQEGHPNFDFQKGLLGIPFVVRTDGRSTGRSTKVA